MDNRIKRLKTEQYSPFLPNNDFLANFDKRSTLLQLSLRPSFITKHITNYQPHQKTQETRKIRDENIRLISRILEISHRKSKMPLSCSQSSLKKREICSRERQITQQNKRLGRSLIKIKSGKTIQKVKQEIAKKAMKKAMKSMNPETFVKTNRDKLYTEGINTMTDSLYLESKLPTQGDEPESPTLYRPLDGYGASNKSLKRGKNMAISEFVELRRVHQ